MSRNAGRAVAASCTLGGMIGIGIIVYSGFGFLGDKAAAQAIGDVGRFRLGYDLGKERAGFSGRPLLTVFVNGNSENWATVSSCLGSASIDAEMASFSGALVDVESEPEVERTLRDQHHVGAFVRDLNGSFLGSLPAGFTCDDLLAFLRSVAREVSPPMKSPIYNTLLLTPEPIDELKSKGNTESAIKYIEFLKEFEGADSQAAQAAESRLNR